MVLLDLCKMASLKINVPFSLVIINVANGQRHSSASHELLLSAQSVGSVWSLIAKQCAHTL